MFASDPNSIRKTSLFNPILLINSLIIRARHFTLEVFKGNILKKYGNL